jgi:hypothetical protein
VAAINLVASIMEADESLLTFLRETLKQDEHDMPRLMAFVVIWSRWKNSADIRQELREQVFQEEDEVNRGIYVALLTALNGVDNAIEEPSTTLEWLKRLVRQGMCGEQVRFLAVNGLEKRWGTNPAVKAFIAEWNELAPKVEKGTDTTEGPVQ